MKPEAIGVRNLNTAPEHEEGHSNTAPEHEEGHSNANSNAGKLENFLLSTADSSDDDSDEDAKSVLSEKVSPAHMQFVTSSRTNASECLCNAYLAKHTLYSTSSGILTSSLCEDVHTLLDLQMNILYEYQVSSNLLGTDEGTDLICYSARCAFRSLWYKQIQFRDYFLTDLEGCCCSANDYYRMMTRTEETIEKFRSQYPAVVERDPDSSVRPLKDMNDLLSLYTSDAVFAAQNTHIYVFESIAKSNFADDFFTSVWENDTQNYTAQSLVVAIDEHLSEMSTCLSNDLLYSKAVSAILKATIRFYIRRLLLKAGEVRKLHKARTRTMKDPTKKKVDDTMSQPFDDSFDIVRRIEADIKIMRTFFEGMVPRIPPLSRVLEHEFSILVTFQECLNVAAGVSLDSSFAAFVTVLHKKTGRNVKVTKIIIDDLWRLVVNTKERHRMRLELKKIEPELKAISSLCDKGETKSLSELSERAEVPGLEMKSILKDFYSEDDRQDYLYRHKVYFPHPFDTSTKKTKEKKNDTTVEGDRWYDRESPDAEPRHIKVAKAVWGEQGKS